MSRLRRLAPLALLLLPLHALAVDEQSEVSVSSQKSVGDYLADLAGESDPDRLYAARVLKGQLARAIRTEQHAKPESLASMDARSQLVELGDRLPAACHVAITHKNAVAPCADIFALLEETAALPQLREVRSTETRKPVIRHLDAAIEALSALPAPAPPSP